MEFKVIDFSTDDRVALITLNRAERLNAWTGRMHHEYRAALAAADSNDSIRVIVVTGAGRGFCVGADSRALEGHSVRGSYDPGVPEDLPSPGASTDPAFDADFAYHFGLSKPIIAAINGPAAGVGFVLACYCDLRFAAPGVKLTTAHGKLNLPAEYGLSWLLPRIVGTGRAMDLLLSSRVILSEEALEWGLVNRIHPSESLLDETLDYARNLASSVSRGSLRESRRQLWKDQHRPVNEAVEYAGDLLSAMMGEDDFGRGVDALARREPPDFQ